MDKLNIKEVGSIVQIPAKQFKALVYNYEALKAINEKLVKANNYLNDEIKKYNKEFVDE